DGDTIRLGIDRLPDTTTAPLVVRYAMTQDATQLAGGLVSGRLGQLHDADPLVGVDAVEIDCNVTSGSTTVSAVAAGGLANRTARDMVDAVDGTGLAANTAVVSTNASSATL